jgi:hypothetical protein
MRNFRNSRTRKTPGKLDLEGSLTENIFCPKHRLKGLPPLQRDLLKKPIHLQPTRLTTLPPKMKMNFPPTRTSLTLLSRPSTSLGKKLMYYETILMQTPRISKVYALMPKSRAAIGHTTLRPCMSTLADHRIETRNSMNNRVQ